MSILHDDMQRTFAEEARRVLDATAGKERLLALLETTWKIDRTFWETAVEQGWAGMAFPEEVGGLGLGLVELGLIAQETGRATAGAPFLTLCAGAAFDPHPATKAWLPRIAQGSAVMTFALAEGNEILPRGPQARFDGSLLDGTKHGVVAGLQADVAIVWAQQDGVPVLVLADLARVTRAAVDSFDNSRGYAHLTFAGTPATLLHTGEAAQAAAIGALARMAVVAAHEQLGGAEALLFLARDYANVRKAFGQPIGAFQSVKHRIAELYGLVEIARANCIHAASREGQPDFLRAAAAARLSATEAYDTAARDCVQIHGGIGVTWEAGIHLHMRRARSLAIELGNMMLWEDILVAELVA